MSDGLKNRDRLYRQVQAYIDANYEPDSSGTSWNPLDILKNKLHDMLGRPTIMTGPDVGSAIDALMEAAEDTFANVLLSLIKSKGKNPVDIYTKAGITKQHFYKIKHNSDYQPTKETAMAFAIALQLTLEETADLLERAGFTLSKSSKRDLIVEYFIKERMYDVDEINFNLDERGFSTLTNRRSAKDE